MFSKDFFQYKQLYPTFAYMGGTRTFVILCVVTI